MFLGVVGARISFCQAGGVKVCSRVVVMRVDVMRVVVMRVDVMRILALGLCLGLGLCLCLGLW